MTTSPAAPPSGDVEGALLPPETGPGEDETFARDAFRVHLENFEGPFDLLLGLISKHKMDVTEVALSRVTDEFIAHIRGRGADWDLGQATEFLVVAATLLDLKAARLLPSADVEDEEDLALLEARDLLFARLLQYRAYKEAAAWLSGRIADESHRFPRSVGLEDRYTSLLPEVLLVLGPDEMAQMAARAMAPRPVPVLSVDHVHAPRVSVLEQAGLLVQRLRRVRSTTFRALVADCPDTLHVVARFLALLELYRESAVAFEQVDALGELNVRWTGSDEGELALDDEFDEADIPDQAEDAEDEDEPTGESGTEPEAPLHTIDLTDVALPDAGEGP